MRPRFAKDYRALVWAFALFPLAPALALASPWLALAAAPIALYAAYAAGVLSHNHNHCPVFANKSANVLYAAWLSVFYGFPIFAWIPTHNQNHHRYLNGEGDATRTSFAGADTLFNALVYGVRAGMWQAPHIGAYLRSLKNRRRALLVRPAVEAAVLVTCHGALLLVLVARHGAGAGAIAYAASLGIPALLAPTFLQLTNYWQHVGCNPASPDDHSRNFVGGVFNFFVFDNGYHTVHHENPGTHWSLYRALHEKRQGRIDPALNQSNPFGFVLRRYFRAAAS